MLLIACLIVMAVLPGRPSEGMAQVGRAAIGGAVGAAGGAVITVSIVVARARFQQVYLDGIEDLFHWQSAPMLITPAVGVAFGLAGRDPLVASIIGSTGGMVLGAAVGAGIGWMTGAYAESPWAGGVIGAGAGMTVGGLTLGIRSWLKHQDDEDGGSSQPIRIGITLPL